MIEILTAFLLDLFFGDPNYSWHPVRIIGGWIQKTEAWLRSRIAGERLAGLFQAVLIPLAAFVSVWFLTELAFQIHPLLKSLVSIYFLYSAIAVTDLEKEARRIYVCLTNRKLETARENLSRIVGRDTKDLNEEQVTRATVESVAESFVDGILSPLFYAAIGGAPLAMAYKAINTLDSMVGRKTPRYLTFGAPAAKLDEWANWIPARISWFLIGIGAAFVNGRTQEAWYAGWKDGAGTSFPNSAVPEAAFAGALGVELGGTNFYDGKKVDTPKLGFPMRSLELGDIRKAYHLMKMSAWTALVFALVLNALAGLLYTKIFNPL